MEMWHCFCQLRQFSKSPPPPLYVFFFLSEVCLYIIFFFSYKEKLDWTGLDWTGLGDGRPLGNSGCRWLLTFLPLLFNPITPRAKLFLLWRACYLIQVQTKDKANPLPAEGGFLEPLLW
jgi:hypothetical protein